jgi:hypothetical protein
LVLEGADAANGRLLG